MLAMINNDQITAIARVWNSRCYFACHCNLSCQQYTAVTTSQFEQRLRSSTICGLLFERSKSVERVHVPTLFVWKM